jgi:hypothetical protein
LVARRYGDRRSKSSVPDITPASLYTPNATADFLSTPLDARHCRTPPPPGLFRDFKKITSDPPSGINATPLEGNIMVWQAVIFGPDDTPGELVWYLALLFVALCVTAVASWSWWLDRFGEVAPTVRVLEVPAKVVPVAAPPVLVPTPRPEEPALARWIPKHDPNERPFPDAPRPSAPPPPPRSGTTQTFATVESPEVSPDTPDAP